MRNLNEALDLLIESLARQSVTYALIGGIAVRAYAVPRNTQDVDAMLSVGTDDLPQFFRQLAHDGFEIPEPYLRGWLDRVQGMPVAKVKVYLSGHGIDVDLFPVESAFQQSVIMRRVQVDVNGRQISIASAEDLVLLKLVAARPRDLLDVADILFISGQLDVLYLRHWADELGIRDRLEHSLAESGHLPP
jgi:hypothetical protein